MKKTEGMVSGNFVPATIGDDLFVKLAELVRSVLDVDGVVVDMRPAPIDEGWPTGASWAFRSDVSLQMARAELHRLSDPIIAYQQGFVAYAGVPVRDQGGAVIGTVAALDRAARTFDAKALDWLSMSAGIVYVSLLTRR